MKIYSVARYDGEYEGKPYVKALIVAGSKTSYPKLYNMNWKDYEEICEAENIETLEGEEIRNFVYRGYPGGKYKIVGIQ